MRWIQVEVRQCFESRMHFAVFFLAAVFACCYAAPNKYIINGTPTTIGDHPYQVSVQWGDFGAFYHMCGGAIIHKNFVVTAQHCCEKYEKDVLFVVVNKDNVTIVSKDDETVLSVKQKHHITLPRQFKENDKIVDDICLLEVNEDLVETGGGKIIEMTDAVEPKINADYTLTGWGYSDNQNTMSDVLLEATDLKILKRKTAAIGELFEDEASSTKWKQRENDEGEETDECKQTLINLGFSGDLLEPHNICTKSVAERTTCNGDSGGPLVYSDGGTPKLVGVVTWGIYPCDRPGTPSIYTNIGLFKEEIDKIAVP